MSLGAFQRRRVTAFDALDFKLATSVWVIEPKKIDKDFVGRLPKTAKFNNYSQEGWVMKKGGVPTFRMGSLPPVVSPMESFV